MVEEVLTDIPGFLQGLYNIVIVPIPEQYRIFINLALYTILIALYSIFIWKFYKFLARRDILRLNLRQYSRTEHPFFHRLWAILLFLLEYIIILPLVVFVWFGILSLFLLILSEGQTVSQILLIAAAIVAATRLTAYVSGELSKDLAKIFPFTVLAIFLLRPDFLSLNMLILRALEIPELLTSILMYLVFIVIVEVVLRFFYTIADLFITTKEESEEKNLPVEIKK
jgi:hypothetical protein